MTLLLKLVNTKFLNKIVFLSKEKNRKGSISTPSTSNNSEDEIISEKRKKALTSLVKQMSQDITNKKVL